MLTSRHRRSLPQNLTSTIIYSPSNYSTVRLEDLEELNRENLDYNIEPLYSDSEGEDIIADAEVNGLLDYLENEL